MTDIIDFYSCHLYAHYFIVIVFYFSLFLLSKSLFILFPSLIKWYSYLYLMIYLLFPFYNQMHVTFI